MARTGKIYQQLMDSIRNKIISGELKINEKLESERVMSEKYGINRMTVRNALKHLEEEGVLESRRGSGTYVKAIPRMEEKIGLGDESEILSLSMQIRQKGMKSSRVLISMSKIVPTGVVRDAFDQEERVYEIIRMSLINDHPYALQKAYIPYSLFADADRYDFESGASLYDYMQDKGYRPKTMISYLRIESLPDEYLEIMQTEKKKKFLLFDYYGFDKDHKLVEYTISYHHADFTKFQFEADIDLSSL